MSKLKKQLLNFLILFIFTLSLIGCSSNTSANKTNTGTTNQSSSSSSKSNLKVSGTLKVHYIDVGQADSILIQQGSHNMLIDAGNNDDSALILDYLKNNGVKKLDYVIGTHPHEDHIGSLDTVINNFEIDKILMPKKTTTTKTFKDVLTAVKNKGLKVTEPIPGTNYDFAESNFTILAPSKNKDYKSLNNFSIVCKLQYGNNSFMFTGDAEDISENEILSRGYDLKSDVLKIGHHGSHSSTTDKFLNKVDPKYAIISCGKNNDYGHPHRETLSRLKAKNIEVYRTDVSQNIICTSDGDKITFDKSPTTSVTSSNKNTSNNINTATNSNNTSRTVYFTPNGKSYHFNKNCPTLKRSKKILEGSLKEALNSKHNDPCNTCAGGK